MSLSRKLNNVLNLGDKIRVKAGKDNINGRGSFIAVGSNYLVWSDNDGNILFTHLGDNISVKKV